MFGRLMPREGRFFDLFNRHADEIIAGSEALAQLMRQYSDVASRRTHIDRIELVEKTPTASPTKRSRYSIKPSSPLSTATTSTSSFRIWTTSWI